MTTDLDALAARLQPHFQLCLPQGAGPFPVVVQMHGCGGASPMQARYAMAARDAGIAAVVINSLAPRGISPPQARLTVCTGARLRGAERANDLVATLRWLEHQPWADRSRVAAVGWSHGGWAIMEALAAARPHPSVATLKLAALFYPYAGPMARTRAHGWGPHHRPKVFACLAGKDAVVGHLAPRRALARLEQDGLDVDVLHLAEATHAFDDETGVDPRWTYRPELTAQAQAAYIAALTTALLQPPISS